MRARFEKVPVDPVRSFQIQERRLARFDAPWHFHPEIELTLIVTSRGRRFVGDSIESFAEGDLVLLGPNLPHFWHNEDRPPRGAKAHAVIAQFREDFLGAEIFAKPEFSAVRNLLRRSARGLQFFGPRAEEASRRMRAAARRAGLPALLELLATLELLAHAKQVRPLASAAYEPSLDRHAERRLARVYDFLIRNFREPLSLRQIARAAAMNREAFSRYFKRATGRNVSVFLNDLRLDHASRLLRETTRRIGDIAAESGFATLSSFNRRFRARMKRTPRKYRQACADAENFPPPSTFLSATESS